MKSPPLPLERWRLRSSDEVGHAPTNPRQSGRDRVVDPPLSRSLGGALLSWKPTRSPHSRDGRERSSFDAPGAAYPSSRRAGQVLLRAAGGRAPSGRRRAARGLLESCTVPTSPKRFDCTPESAGLRAISSGFPRRRDGGRRDSRARSLSLRLSLCSPEARRPLLSGSVEMAASWSLLIHQLPPEPLYLRAEDPPASRPGGRRRAQERGLCPPGRSGSRTALEAIAAEAMAGGGQAHVCRASFLDERTDAGIVDLFRAEREEDYERLQASLPGPHLPPAPPKPPAARPPGGLRPGSGSRRSRQSTSSRRRDASRSESCLDGLAETVSSRGSRSPGRRPAWIDAELSG